MTRRRNRMFTQWARALGLVTIGGTAAAMTACGAPSLPSGAGAGPTNSASSGAPTSAPATTPDPTATPTASTTGRVGDTLTYTDSGGTSIQVTLVQIFDPASGTDDTSPPDGTRWVGFEGTINGEGATDDAMTFDVVGSDGQTYGFNTSYHLGTFSGCTATADPTEGQPVTFCSGVGLPPGVTVAKVGYSVEGVDVGVAPELFWTSQ